MLDFIFGDMVSEEERIEKYRSVVRGVSHLSHRNPLKARPGDMVSLTLSTGPDMLTENAFIYYTTDGLDPVGKNGKAKNGSVITMQKSKVTWNMPEWGYVQEYTGVIPAQKAGTLVRYRLSSLSPAGDEIFADGGKYYAYCVDDYSVPQWAKEAIIYHIMVDRFSPGMGRSWMTVRDVEDIYGGTLRGILEKIDYIHDLGANTLYLSPLFPCNSHHGYDSTDYFEIEPRFGTKDDFRALLVALHEKGMKFIMDFVPNHWSVNHPTFQDAVNNPNSNFRDWYIFKEYPIEYECFFNVREMPKINLRNPSAKQHILDAARYWLEFGVDGFRIDHAIGPTPDFWADFRAVVKQTNPDCWIFGEVIDPPDSQKAFVGLLDGCLDFHLLEFMRKTFGVRKWDLVKFSAFLQKHSSFFPDDFLLPSMLDNHDMDRFLWIAGNDTRRLKLAALMQCFLPNPPLLYYGTEIGLSQRIGIRSEYGGFGHLGEARLPMEWGEEQDQDLYYFFQQLYQLRKELAFYKRRTISIEKVTSTELILTLENNPSIQLMINVGEEEKQFELTNSTFTSFFSSSECGAKKIEHGMKLSLPACSGAILY
ncbi:MAG: alpha-amylase [Anaerolineaceae bacterium]|jgi:glycosidase|nr:MAG: alpha-amylase [Anaerolineaceae bacterium]